MGRATDLAGAAPMRVAQGGSHWEGRTGPRTTRIVAPPTCRASGDVGLGGGVVSPSASGAGSEPREAGERARCDSRPVRGRQANSRPLTCRPPGLGSRSSREAFGSDRDPRTGSARGAGCRTRESRASRGARLYPGPRVGYPDAPSAGPRIPRADRPAAPRSTRCDRVADCAPSPFPGEADDRHPRSLRPRAGPIPHRPGIRTTPGRAPPPLRRRPCAADRVVRARTRSSPRRPV